MSDHQHQIDRIKRVRKALKSAELDAIVILNRTNTRYLTGFVASYSITVIDGGGVRVVTDPRYGEAAEAALDGIATVVVQPTTNVQDFLRKLFKKSDYKRVGFEGSISVDEYDNLRKLFRRTKLEKAGHLISELRKVKDESELRQIRKAVRLADRVMGEALDRLKPGLSEQELSRSIRFLMEELGGEGESFSNIVASGPNSSRPHHHPGGRRFKKGEPITIDLGGIVGGYCSDLTRTPVLGSPSREFQQIYEVCLEAQQTAIRGLKPGMTGRDADALARNVIEAAGFGEYFGHGLGHGVGLEIHEDPRLSPRADDYELRPGNVVTVEPGIYLPGVCGVRIEDYVLITEDGCEVLSKTPRRLQLIG